MPDESFDLPCPLLTKEGKRLLRIETINPKADRFIRFLPFVRGGQEG